MRSSARRSSQKAPSAALAPRRSLRRTGSTSPLTSASAALHLGPSVQSASLRARAPTHLRTSNYRLDRFLRRRFMQSAAPSGSTSAACLRLKTKNAYGRRSRGESSLDSEAGCTEGSRSEAEPAKESGSVLPVRCSERSGDNEGDGPLCADRQAVEHQRQ